MSYKLSQFLFFFFHPFERSLRNFTKEIFYFFMEKEIFIEMLKFLEFNFSILVIFKKLYYN